MSLFASMANYLKTEMMEKSRGLFPQRDKLLHIEDEEEAQKEVREYLKDEGYEIIAVKSQKEAMEKIRGHNFQGMVIDYKLGRTQGSGLRIVVEIQQLYPELRSVFLSHYGDEIATVLRSYDNIKVIDVLDKTLIKNDPMILRRAVRNCVNHTKHGTWTYSASEILNRFAKEKMKVVRREICEVDEVTREYVTAKVIYPTRSDGMERYLTIPTSLLIDTGATNLKSRFEFIVYNDGGGSILSEVLPVQDEKLKANLDESELEEQVVKIDPAVFRRIEKGQKEAGNE